MHPFHNVVVLKYNVRETGPKPFMDLMDATCVGQPTAAVMFDKDTHPFVRRTFISKLCEIRTEPLIPPRFRSINTEAYTLKERFDYGKGGVLLDERTGALQALWIAEDGSGSDRIWLGLPSLYAAPLIKSLQLWTTRWRSELKLGKTYR
jgi:hypothetical protein